MIDWNWPIEFMDGTPAWVVDDEEMGEGCTLIQTHTLPYGISMARGNGSTWVKMCEDDERCIRNIPLPAIRFEDGTAPSRGSLKDPRTIILWSANGFEKYAYSWPGFKRFVDTAPKVTTLNKKQLVAVEQEEAEKEEIEGSDFYGMF